MKIVLASVYAILILLLLLTPRACSCTPAGGQNDRTDRDDNRGEAPADTARAEGRAIQPDEEEVRRAERVGHRGALKVTLLWDFQADIDLHVLQPNGRVIFFQSKRDPSTGGELDVDNTDGGPGSAENIYWENPPKGEYYVKLNYYNYSSARMESGPCKVIIMRQGEPDRAYEVDMREKGDSKLVAHFVIE